MLTKLTFEISAVCNARCPYCVTGTRINAEVPEGERFLSAKKAGAVMDFLLRERIITPEIGIDLYNWGEPFLHPDLNGVLNEFARRKYYYTLSTNGSIYRRLDPEALATLKQIIFSFPGFSQASYDRIHGFNFEHIKDNVASLVRDIRAANPNTQLFMSFHIYQFNLLEMAAARDWCTKLGIVFFPYTACWNGYELSRRYRKGLIEGSRDLILGYENAAIEYCKSFDYRCGQWDTLTLDQTGRVVLCCVMDTSNPDFGFKDILQCSNEEIQKWKTSRPVCRECLSLGISQWVFYGIIQNWDSLMMGKGNRITAFKYESTISWRITKPLRMAGKYLKLRQSKNAG
jgi:MoaA/NifB/PqqE/SkfB family radical SAM enzyme